MDKSVARLASIILSLSIVVGAWLMFEQDKLPAKGEGQNFPDSGGNRAEKTTRRQQQSPTMTNTDTVYKCRGKAGVSFRNSPCGSNETQVETVATTIVPSDPNELARLKEKAAQMEATRLAKEKAWAAAAPVISTSVTNTRVECDNIDRSIAAIDARLRQPYYPATGDYWTGERKKLTDRRFSIGC